MAEKAIYKLTTPSGDPVRVEEAWKDAEGNTITETYETKEDAIAKINALPEDLQKYFVYKTDKPGKYQTIGTGLYCSYTDSRNNMVTFGTEPSLDPLRTGFVVRVVDENMDYYGTIYLGAMNYKFSFSDSVDVFSVDEEATKVGGPDGTTSVELGLEGATITANSVKIELPDADSTFAVGNNFTISKAGVMQAMTAKAGNIFVSGRIDLGELSALYHKAPAFNDEVANKSYVDKTAEEQAKAVQTDLQAKIDAINASQNFVATYATEKDLPSAPTAGVLDGDCALVLKDGDKLNQSTVYKWTGSKWEYVGELGDYYTKAQINAEFAKTNGNVAYYRSQADSYAKKVDDYANATDDKIAELGKVVDTAKDAYLASTPTFVETSSSTEESDVTPTLVGLFAETGSSTTISE